MLRLVTAAEQEPVSLAEARAHIRDDTGAFDALLPGLISAAREIVEQQTGLALVEASYEWTPEGDCASPLPLLPAEVTSEEGAIPVQFTTKPGPLPSGLRAAVLMIVADLVQNPSAGGKEALQVNPTVQNLIFPHRRVVL